MGDFDFSFDFDAFAENIKQTFGGKDESTPETHEDVHAPTEDDVSPVADVVPTEVSASPFPTLTDDDYSRIFGEIAAEAKQEQEIIAAATAVVEAEAYVQELAAQHDAAKAEVAEIDKEVAALEKQMNELKRKRTAANEKLYDVSTGMRQRAKSVQSNIILARQALQDWQAANEMALLSDVWEKRARQYSWFNGIADDDGQTMKVLPHQWDAMRFIAAGKRVILGDKMGLGKTLSAIGTLDITEAKRVLVITPSDIAGNFIDEFHFWAGHRPALSIKGQSKATRASMLSALSFLDTFVVAVNYEAWRRDHKLIEQFIDLHFDTVICDEAHTIKETTTSAFKGVEEIIHAMNKCPLDNNAIPYKGKCPLCGWSGESWNSESPFDQAYWEARSVQRVVLMSGTPILNKPHDLFALLTLIDPVTFYNKNRYLDTYAMWDWEAKNYVFAPGGIDRLIKRLSGRFLARTLTDAGIVLPPQKPIIHTVELDPERYAKQAMIIEQISKYYEIVLDNERRIPMTAIIAMITRQRQANVWAGGITLKDPSTGEVVFSVGEEVQESVKLDKAVELIKEFTAQGDRVAVFSQFSTALRELQGRVNMAENDNGDPIFSVVYDGSTPADVRDEVRRNFDRKNNEIKKWDVVLANYKTGGQGLNLTGATHTIILDREWNPGKEDQALARTHRIGQTESTFVHIIEIPDTIDEWMNSLIDSKKMMIDGFNEGADELRTQLLDKLRTRKPTTEQE